MSEEVGLSIVVISRNLERYIGKCLTSILKASENIEGCEIILVDSASTDRTIEIAMEYPIRIIQIEDERLISPSAGRYIGYLHSKGRYIYFHDGDSTLYKGWLEKALSYLESHEKVAGVVGIITQEPYDNIIAKKWIDANRNQPIGPVREFESFIMVRKEVLDSVGSFNPWLKSKEEGELAARMLHSGYIIERIPYRVAHHFGYEKEDLGTEFKRKMASASALGVILRLHLSNKDIRKYYFKGSGNFLILGITFSMVLLGIFFAFILNFYPILYISILAMFFACIYIVSSAKGLLSGIPTIISGVFRWPLFIYGFLKPESSVSDYQVKISIVKA